ncbi:hypothetical protein ACIGNX_01580 [Actinosynnema sp. NPDC053489]|uniref:hypothetical protein n=1 Tax=Actinosynnema sp. NPDC053489 TaxID=3363916 RepID=UPI0037C96D57
MSKPVNIPGRGGASRDEEITQLLRRLQEWYDHPVGSPDDVESQKQMIRPVLDRLAQAANPGAQHTSSEVGGAIDAARKLLDNRR